MSARRGDSRCREGPAHARCKGERSCFRETQSPVTRSIQSFSNARDADTDCHFISRGIAPAFSYASCWLQLSKTAATRRGILCKMSGCYDGDVSRGLQRARSASCARVQSGLRGRGLVDRRNPLPHASQHESAPDRRSSIIAVGINAKNALCVGKQENSEGDKLGPAEAPPLPCRQQEVQPASGSGGSVSRMSREHSMPCRSAQDLWFLNSFVVIASLRLHVATHTDNLLCHVRSNMTPQNAGCEWVDNSLRAVLLRAAREKKVLSIYVYTGAKQRTFAVRDQGALCR